MRWANEYVFVSHALAGEPVGLEPVGDQLWRVWFSFYEIGLFDESTLRIRRPTQEPK
jgi:hypothetical protein